MRPLLILALTFAAAAAAATAAPRRPFPQHVVYAAGTIRPSVRTQGQMDADVAAYYDAWKQAFLVPAGASLYRVSYGSTDRGRTVSEGQGYGMVIAALMAGHDPDAQTIFDGLWKFARKYPSRIDHRLMSWQVPPGNDDSAFDGDADIAYALLLANAQWGSDGEIDYRAEARSYIEAILQSTIGPASRLPMLGDWVESNGGEYNQYTVRSSDFMPGHFRAYAAATGDPVWNDVVLATQSVIEQLQTTYAPNTGLLPDFIVSVPPRPASPFFLEAETDGQYSYNAGRDPWRLGIDALQSGDPVSMAQAARISRWARQATGGNPLALHAGYRLDGSPSPNRNYFTIFFAAPLGVAAMTDPAQQAWLDAIYESVRTRHEDYYEDSVTLQCLLAMTGNAWSPIPSPAKRRAVRSSEAFPSKPQSLNSATAHFR